MPKTTNTNHTNHTNHTETTNRAPSTPRDRTRTLAKNRRGSPKSPPDAPIRVTCKATLRKANKAKPYASLDF